MSVFGYKKLKSNTYNIRKTITSLLWIMGFYNINASKNAYAYQVRVD